MRLLSAFLFVCAATAQYVPGKAFDRYIAIWLENIDYPKAHDDPNLKWLSTLGITLSNYFAVTHPSLPNYVAATGGDYYGLDNDKHNTLPANISSVVDILEDKNITWGEYQESMPYTGFAGDYPNPESKANMYVRKHNPLIMYDSVASNPSRVQNIKNFTLFYQDLAAQQLPQWMFITPNMTSDGHDTSVTFAGSWLRNFLTPLLNNKYFMNNTLIHITFDESHTYSIPNRVLGILIGGAVPEDLSGTTDDNYFDHYSALATVQANWGLATLGRRDVGANVFGFVADQTESQVRKYPGNLDSVFLNESYPGFLNSKRWAPMPVPNSDLVTQGRGVYFDVQRVWGSLQKETVYNGSLVVPWRYDPPEKIEGGGNDASSGSHGRKPVASSGSAVWWRAIWGAVLSGFVFS